MLNDVHFPPREASMKAHRPLGPRVRSDATDANTARVLDRLPTAARADVGEAIYGEPEDRGDSFNTSMSLLVVLIVTLTVTGLVLWMSV